jgi:hypothetical protein
VTRLDLISESERAGIACSYLEWSKCGRRLFGMKRPKLHKTQTPI